MAPQASADCSGTAVQVRIGLDANRNQSLDADEVSYTELVCTGSGVQGGQRVAVVDEPAGANCAAGGKRLLVGIDTSGDGQLQAAEVSSTAYVCNGEAGTGGAAGPAGPAGPSGPGGTGSLLSMSPEPAGGNCPAGGTFVRSGPDTDGNGVLDAGEVAQSAYVCQGATGATGATGANGTSSLLAVTPEAAGGNCTHGGTQVRSGVDADGDGVLDAGEVAQTAYVCNPPPAGLTWVSTAASVEADANTGYITTAMSEVAVTLPDNPAIGSVVRVSGLGVGGWRLAQRAGTSIGTDNLPAGASWGATWRGHRANRLRTNVAMSANGRYVLTGEFMGLIEVSSDYGRTWTTPEGNSRRWRAFAMSRDGRIMLAGADDAGPVVMSSDHGATWSSVPGLPNEQWSQAAMSANGEIIILATSAMRLHRSGDGGASWTEVGPASRHLWRGLAMSADGRHVIATAQREFGPGLPEQAFLAVSSDFGQTWTARDSRRAWIGSAVSADGSRMWALETDGIAYQSTDFGATWLPRAFTAAWSQIASSEDGRNLVAVAQGSPVHTSSDFGATWVHRDTGRNWMGVACSRDCGRIVATGSGIAIYTSPAATTVGTGGYLAGESGASVEVMYMGGGTWSVLSHAGTIEAR